MKGIPNTERQRLGALLDHETQETVMAMIPQFSETEIGAPVPAPAEVPEELGLLVFNMERGVHLEELGDFLQDCPGVRPLDVVLANELDDGCVRSGGRNTARELAERFGWNYAYGLEFIELVNGEDPKGFHGNAVFSRWPIRRAWTVRLPEQYNWYFDRQRRIGGRCAVLAELDVGGRPLGVASIHLENRTHGEGRRLQLEAVLRAAEINADVILLAKNIDGVYDCDPAKNADAVKFDAITYDEVLGRHLAVMDSTATSLSMDNHIPVLVFALKDPYNIVRVLRGEKIGTIVKEA